MALISKGITLAYAETAEVAEFTQLADLMDFPELGAGEADSIEITTLADSAHKYTKGLDNYGDSIAFKFLYNGAQFTILGAMNKELFWKVSLPDSTNCTFSGEPSVKLDGVGVNAALTYTLSVKPNSAMVWG